MKKSFLKIMFGALIALIIPLLGNQFVDGWNWGIGDFIFAWVFLVVMCLAILLVIKKVSNKTLRIVISILVFLVFAFVWGLLATG